MYTALTWSARICAVVGYVATAVACAWLLGMAALAPPHTVPLVWGGVAATCAVVRTAALWGVRSVKPRVSLAKPASASRYDQAMVDLSFDNSPSWVKARTCGMWALVAFAAGALFVPVVSGSPGQTISALQKAGATVSTAVVVEAPSSVEKDLSEDIVRGYYANLVVSVPDGPGRLSVHRAYTRDRPHQGASVEVLWSPSAPRIGGVVHERRDLHLYAQPRWEAFPDSAGGRDALFALIIVTFVGLVIGLLITLGSDSEALQELAWSPVAQTVRAVVIVGLYLAWLPMLTAHKLSGLTGLFAASGFMTVLLVYCFTSVRAIGEG
ncbi:hypothetical protein [Actinacidiphila soli]|uniref:hypothetical protein n=1 Tax=Actinacidiphila soli TaxID=2487275 RepID=UPI000FCB08DB|nr:hypothetical protein [Actinacidiphila soli]